MRKYKMVYKKYFKFVWSNKVVCFYVVKRKVFYDLYFFSEIFNSWVYCMSFRKLDDSVLYAMRKCNANINNLSWSYGRYF